MTSNQITARRRRVRASAQRAHHWSEILSAHIDGDAGYIFVSAIARRLFDEASAALRHAEAVAALEYAEKLKTRKAA